MTRLGIFGGTFDPPHVGHLILATEAQYQLQLERVLWVLTPYPPHKAGQSISPVDERFELLSASLEGNPDFELSRVDLDRPPPHYAVDTVALLRKTYPAAELVYLMGGNSLADLPTWHTPQAFVQACDEIGVMQRPGRAYNLPDLEVILPGLTEAGALYPGAAIGDLIFTLAPQDRRRPTLPLLLPAEGVPDHPGARAVPQSVRQIPKRQNTG